MLTPITIKYAIRPVKRSIDSGQVADLFGLPNENETHTICENLQLDLDIQSQGKIVLITGPSGSGKSSILRAIGTQLNALDANTITWPQLPLIDAIRHAATTKAGRSTRKAKWRCEDCSSQRTGCEV